MSDRRPIAVKHFLTEIAKKYNQRRNALGEVKRNTGTKDVVSTIETGASAQEVIRFFVNTFETGFKDTPSVFQRTLMESNLVSFLPVLVGYSSWALEGEQICRDMNIKYRSDITMIMAARRQGKSRGQAMVVASRTLTKIKFESEPDTQAVFSTGQRASELFRDYVTELLVELGLGEHIDAYRGENVRVSKMPLWMQKKQNPHCVLKFLPAKASVSFLFFLFFGCFHTGT